MTKDLFSKKSINKLNDPDDLEKYLQITNPSIWLILGSCIALLLGMLAWGIWGEISTGVNSYAVSLNGEIFCLLSANEIPEIKIGDSANFVDTYITVSNIAKFPISRREAEELIGNDYLSSTIIPDDWVYRVDFTSDKGIDVQEGVPINILITTQRISPISLILNN